MKRFFQKFWDVVKNFFQRLWEDIKTPFKFINKTYSNSLATRYIFYFSILLIIFLLVQRFILNFTEWADWTGFSKITTISIDPNTNKKVSEEIHFQTLWDWVVLLLPIFIPVFLGFLLEKYKKDQKEKELLIVSEKQYEDRLQSFYNNIENLILEKNLRNTEQNQDVNIIARTRTISIIRSVNNERVSSILKFLKEAQLIGIKNGVINLENVDLSEKDFSYVDFSSLKMKNSNFFRSNLYACVFTKGEFSNSNFGFANLEKANLRESDFSDIDSYEGNFSFIDGIYSNFSNSFMFNTLMKNSLLRATNFENSSLFEVDFSYSDMYHAHFYKANLSGSILFRTNLLNAKITFEQLSKVKILDGAILPDGRVFHGDPKNILKPPYSPAQ